MSGSNERTGELSAFFLSIERESDPQATSGAATMCALKNYLDTRMSPDNFLSRKLFS